MTEAQPKLLLLVTLVTCACGCSETRQSVTEKKADVIPAAHDIAVVDTKPEATDASSALVDQAEEDVGISTNDSTVDPDPGLTIDVTTAPTDTAKPVQHALVVVTLNTHSFQEGPDSIEKLEQIGQGLAALDVDLVGLNEVMSGTFWAYDYGGGLPTVSQVTYRVRAEVSAGRRSPAPTGVATGSVE